METKPPFRFKVRTFCEKVVRVRRFLSKRNIVPTYQTLVDLDKFDRQLQYVRFIDDLAAARFIYKYQDLIHNLIPGKNSGCSSKFKSDLAALLNEANSIIKTMEVV
jgi:hypothetical protein